jgi:NCS1 family nucleobase:cation symporter-1
MMADYYLVKRQVVETPELYTMAASGRYHYDGGWNHVGLRALAISGVIAIGWELSTQLLGILPPNNLGWAIGAIAGAVAYTLLMRRAGRT